MRIIAIFAAALFLIVAGPAHGAAKSKKGVCLKVAGEKIEVRNLPVSPVVIDRDGVPDFVSTSMMKSVTTAKGSESYNILLSGVKRNAAKAIVSFDVKVDEKEYSYPKDSCAK